MSAHKAVQPRLADLRYAITVLAAMAAFAWIVITLQGQGHDLRVTRDDLSTSNQARDALARQVQELGEAPVAGPPGSRGEPGEAAIGSRGPQGEPGPIGPTGPAGPIGSTGDDGSDGIGTPGPTGAPGTDGQSVVGPAGPQGEAGPAGPPGADGAPGKDGADGQNGSDGQTCPDGYSLQPLKNDPDALVCRRTVAEEPPPADQSRGLLGLGALTATAFYRRLDA